MKELVLKIDSPSRQSPHICHKSGKTGNRASVVYACGGDSVSQELVSIIF